MELSEYQRQASNTAIYPGRGSLLGLAYVGLGLGEAGEVQGKIKKIIRDDGGEITDAARIHIAKELGDVLWYVAMAADEIGISLNRIAEGNLRKLDDRRHAGTLQGSGDNR